MSDVIDEFPTRQGRPPIYPWGIWSDGQVYKLYAGEDFNGQAASFRVLAHRTAKTMGLKVETAIVDDGEAIIIEFKEADGSPLTS
jgi:hypothetical protein